MPEESELEKARKAVAYILLGYKPKNGQSLEDFIKDAERSLRENEEANLESA